MAIRWSKTDDTQGKPLRVLIHGASGAGKTYLARTVPDPSKCVLVAVEDGALSLADVNMHVARIEKSDDLADVFAAVANKPEIGWIYVDSITEWAEMILFEEMAKTSDGRRAYGEMQNKVKYFLGAIMPRAPQHVVCTAKQEAIQTDVGRVLVPNMPGATLVHKSPIAHSFDCVFCLHVVDGEAGGVRMLQTDMAAGPNYLSKTRDPWKRVKPMEPANLAAIAAKLRPTTPTPASDTE